MARVGFLGAFSIDNAGDVLVGLAGRQALRAVVPGLEERIYAPALPTFAHDVSDGVTLVPAGEDMAWARDLDALVIGGGGVIETDPAFRPFLLGRPERWPAEIPAAWNAVCSQNQAWYAAGLDDAYRAVARCCEALRYVSVRNRTTLTFVRRCGFAGPVSVVPDPSLLLELPAGIDAAVDAVLREAGVDPARPFVGVSVGSAVEDPRAGDFFGDLFAGLGRCGLPLVVFPFGHVRGDAGHAAIAAARLPGATLIRRRLRPLEAWRLVGRARLCVVTRYHAVLAALAQEVPFVVLDEYLSDHVASSKIRELTADLGLEPFYLCPFLSRTPSWKLDGLLEAGAAVSFARTVADCRRRLRAHFVAMAAALGLTPA